MTKIKMIAHWARDRVVLLALLQMAEVKAHRGRK